MEESLSEGQKALLVLRKGFEAQKSAILTGLGRLQGCAELEAVVELICEEIGAWEESLQEQAGQGALRLIPTSPVPAQSFLPLSLSLLSCPSPVQSTWLCVFQACLQAVPADYVRSCCVPIVLQLAEPVKSIPTRAVACQLLGMLAGVLKEDFSGDLSERTLGLAQDPNYEVRLRMTEVFGTIVRSTGLNERPKMLEEVIRLVQDDQLEVRTAAVKLLGEVQDLYSAQQQTAVLVPLLTAELLPDPDLNSSLCSSLSPILLCCQNHPHALRTIFSFCQRMQSTPSDSIQISLISSLPTLLTIFPSADFAYIERFWTHGSLHTRTVLSQIYPQVRHKQVLSQMSSSPSQLLYLQMLENPATSYPAACHLSAGFKFLSASNQSQALQALKLLLDGKLPWREVLEVLKQIPDFMDMWSIRDSLMHIQPAVLEVMEKGGWRLQLECADILCRMIEQNYYKAKRLAVCKLVVEEYGFSQTYRKRMIFVSFCSLVVQRVSKGTFQALFFPLLLELCRDSVSSVRLHLAILLPSIGRIFTSDEDWSRAVSDAMKRLAEDQCKDVAERANAGLQVMSEYEYWAASKREEMENAKRVEREKKHEAREVLEREEEKRAMLQELTRKARLDYRNASRRSSSKASSSRTTPTRVKQRNSMSQEKPPQPTIRPFRLPRSKKK